jgi:Protein phosphatase 2C
MGQRGMTPAIWRFAAASELGTSHAKIGGPCQDANVCEVLLSSTGEAILVAVVADGAGSATRSGDGAQLACTLVLDEARALCELGRSTSSLSREAICEWLTRFQSEIKIRADAEGLTPRDFACTLLATIVGHEHAVFFQIGDGAMVVSEGDDYAWIFWPDNGEYENITFFATDPSASDHLQFDTCDHKIDEIALFSDGLQRLALHYQTRTAHTPFFRALFSTVRKAEGTTSESLSNKLSAYLTSPQINERTDDDKTLILATRRSTEPSNSPASLAGSPDDLR